MKSKLRYLAKVSLDRKIKTKWFAIVNIILAIAIIGIINIDSIISAFGGDFDTQTEVHIIDDTERSYDMFISQFNIAEKTLYGETDSKYNISKYDKTFDEAKEELAKIEKGNHIYLYFEPSEENVIAVTMLTKDFLDMMDTQLLSSAINNTKVSLGIVDSNIPIETINKIYEPIEINRVVLNEEQNDVDENMNMIMTTVFPLLVLPFFMLVIFLVQMIGAEVNDEKTTRGMEIIIANVSPKTHFFAKVIAGNLFVLIQGMLLIGSVLIGFLVRNIIGGANITGGIGAEVSGIVSQILNSGIGAKIGPYLLLAILLMLITFISYSLLAGILASMTTNSEDYQQVQTPIIIITLVGYYLAMMAGIFKGAVFIKILSYVPLISAILSPSLLVLGQIGIFDFIISILLVLGLNYLLIKYGLKIYKVGILNYSSKDLWKKMFKAIKEK